MKKIKLERLNKEVIIKTLDNGLTILFCKTPDYLIKCAYFVTNYGSKDNDFIPIGENKIKSYPKGIAHFLEHKVFEQQDGKIIFDEFEKNLGSVNAFTSHAQTQYYFTSSKNFYKNLKLLLDFVQCPYFTDKNVEKEKGIISQELVMYKDDPDWVFYEKRNENLFVSSGYKYKIGGTTQEIKKITKEDLYSCYNTFYNPSNMYLVITGDLDENEVLEFVKNNQNSKKYHKQDKIIIENKDEPKQVAVKKETIKSNVVAQRSSVAYKIYSKNNKDKETYKIEKYLSIYLDSLFCSLTTILEDMIQGKIVKSYFDYYLFRAEGYIIILFEGNTINHKKFVNIINNMLIKKEFNKETFEIHRKSIISRTASNYDSPIKINKIINDLYYTYNQVFGNIIEINESLNYEEYKDIINSTDFSNKLELIMKPKDKK